jgi:glucan phosphoethanolaminetransferase (alkaline phosphatase superfamily)
LLGGYELVGVLIPGKQRKWTPSKVSDCTVSYGAPHSKMLWIYFVIWLYIYFVFVMLIVLVILHSESMASFTQPLDVVLGLVSLGSGSVCVL